MPRIMSGDYARAIASQVTKPALFVEIHFISGPVYVWTGAYSIDWNGHTWVGIGGLGSISTIEEGSTVEAKGITLSLSGIQADLLTDILQEFQVGLPAIVYLGFFGTGTGSSGGYGIGGYGEGGYGTGSSDDSNTLIPDPIISWAGRTDQPTIDMDGSTATISINCENQLVEMNTTVDRRYTNEDQQLDYPGDRGMEFVNSIQDARIFWGSAPSSKNNL